MDCRTTLPRNTNDERDRVLSFLRVVAERDDWSRSDDRGQLRTSFDSAADLHQRARPEYPEALHDALIATAGLDAGARLLEIGCATGKATLPLARRGFRLTSVELGPALTSVARRNLTSRTSRSLRVRSRRLTHRRLTCSTSCSRPRPGTGSTRRSDTDVRGNCSCRADTSRSGAPPTSSRRTAIRSSLSCKRSTRRSARVGRMVLLSAAGRVARRARGDRTKRPVQRRRRAPLRLGRRVRRGGLPRTARHLLWPHHDEAMAARPPLLRDPAPAWEASEWEPSSRLGRRSSRRPPTKRAGRPVSRTTCGTDGAAVAPITAVVAIAVSGSVTGTLRVPIRCRTEWTRASSTSRPGLDRHTRAESRGSRSPSERALCGRPVSSSPTPTARSCSSAPGRQRARPTSATASGAARPSQ